MNVKMTSSNGDAVEIETDNVDEVRFLFEMAKQVLFTPQPSSSQPLPAAPESKSPKISAAAFYPIAAASPPPNKAASQKEKRVERMNRARRLNNEGGPSQTVCMVRAMKEIGKPVTAEGLYEYMDNHTQIGYRTTAVDPLHGLKQALRQKTRLFTDIGKKTYILTDGAENILTQPGKPSHGDRSASSATLFQDSAQTPETT